MKKLIIFILSLIAFGCQPKKAKKPNVLFIVIDDLKTELNCYGQSQIKTPNIDNLAGESLLFNRAYVQNPVCGASRCSMLSGLRPTDKRFWDYNSKVDVDAPGTITLPQAFKENGYHTLSNGKVFHHLEDTEARSWSENAWLPKNYSSGRTMLDEDSPNHIGGLRERGPFFESPDVPDSAYVDGKILQKSIDDLKRLSKKDDPFFLAVGFLKPHLPFYAPKKYWDLYNEDSIQLASNRYRPEDAPASLKGSSEIRFYHGMDIDYNSDAFHKKAKHGYYACVSYADALVGKLLETLDSLELDDNTIVVLVGDHGWHLGEHDFWGKHNTLHNAINAPMIFRAPGFKGNTQTDALVEFIDIYPTLCELTGIDLPEHVQGKSFVPLMKEPKRKWKEAVFTRYKYGNAVVTENYTYTEYSGNGLEENMLYNLNQDAEENINIAGKEEYKEVVKMMSNILDEGYKKVLVGQ
jgi:arylsulfatase A-like enzyme